MKPLYVLVGIMLIRVTLIAQGIRFEEGLSWQEILNKAKIENKYIFVDCYTTWCGPCKIMERDVYTSDSVGKFFNNTIISVKAQIDRTSYDNAATKEWYEDASIIEKKYAVNSYPTYLFFTPDGELIHKDVGLKGVTAFINVAVTALAPGKKYDDPFKEYRVLIAEYNQGKKNYQKILYMIAKAKESRDNDAVTKLSQDYYYYLRQLPWKKLFIKDKLQFLAENIQKSSSPFFPVFFKNEKKVNTIMKNNFFAYQVVDRIIQKEECEGMLGKRGSSTGIVWNDYSTSATEPNWNIMNRNIKKKYNEAYADRNVRAAKIKWYNNYEQWPQWITCSLEQVKKYGSDTSDVMADVGLNMIGWRVFLFSQDSTHISSATKIMEDVSRRKCCTPMAFIWDTYARLLYKGGRTQEGIIWEDRAINSVAGTDQEKGVDFEDYKLTLEKMKKGEKIW